MSSYLRVPPNPNSNNLAAGPTANNTLNQPGIPNMKVITEAQDQSAVVTWTNPNPGLILCYRIERKLQGGSYTLLVDRTTDDATGIIDQSVVVGNTYVYRVTAMTEEGFGVASGEAQILIQAITNNAPGAPTNLVAQVISSTEIDLAWTPPANQGGSAIVAYLLERSQDGGATFPFAVQTADATPSYQDGSVSRSTLYTYRVSAINNTDTSVPSASVSAQTPANLPGAPTNLQAFNVSSSEIDLSWTAPADNGGSPIIGYKIERESPVGGGFSVIIANTNLTITTDNDTGLASATQYNYRVSAINAIGTSSPSNAANATTGAPNTPPSAPRTLNAVTISTSEIDIFWAPPLSSGSSAIIGYKIERESPLGGGFSTLVANTGNTNISYQDTGLNPNTQYNYRVSAINSNGTSSASGASNSTTQATPSLDRFGITKIYPTLHEILADAIAKSSAAAVNSITVPHTLWGKSDRCVLVFVEMRNASILTATATYNGVSMTQIGSITGGSNRMLKVFAIMESSLPAAGTYNVVVTPSATVADIVVGVHSFAGVDQTGVPSNVVTAADNVGSATSSVSITTVADNSMIVDGLLVLGSGNTPVVDPSQTQDYNMAQTGAFPLVGAGSHKLSVILGSYTMVWTLPSAVWLHAAVELKLKTQAMVWTSQWDVNARTITTPTDASDPSDPMFDPQHGTAVIHVDGAGIAKVGGASPRLYVHHPVLSPATNTPEWRNFEATVYAQRISDTSGATDGVAWRGRTNHGVNPEDNITPETNFPCDSRSYQATLRNDGQTDFLKETGNPFGTTTRVSAYQYFYSGSTYLTPINFPFNVWYGFKWVVYDLGNGNVKVETYIDLTNGLNGGTWLRLNAFEDNGSNWATGATACNVSVGGLTAALQLTNSSSRLGSENSTPNLTVFLRANNINTDGVQYKNASIREIDVSTPNVGQLSVPIILLLFEPNTSASETIAQAKLKSGDKVYYYILTGASYTQSYVDNLNASQSGYAAGVTATTIWRPPTVNGSTIAGAEANVDALPNNVHWLLADYENSFEPNILPADPSIATAISVINRYRAVVNKYNTRTGGDMKLYYSVSYPDVQGDNWDWSQIAALVDILSPQNQRYQDSNPTKSLANAQHIHDTAGTPCAFQSTISSRTMAGAINLSRQYTLIPGCNGVVIFTGSNTTGLAQILQILR